MESTVTLRQFERQAATKKTQILKRLKIDMGRHGFIHNLLMIALCVLPVLLLAFALGSGIAVSPWIFIALLLLCFAGMYAMMGHHGAEDSGRDEADELVRDSGEAPPPEGVPEDLVHRAADVIHPLATYRQGDHYVIEGPLKVEPDAAYDTLQQRFSGMELVPYLQEQADGRPMLILAPAQALPEPVQKKSRPWLNLVLFLATLATTIWAGAAHQGIDLLEEPGQFTAGLPYAVALMLILGAHELGHYFTARRYGIQVSLPYFIPLPFALGTFGAFIQMKSLSPNRRAIFDVALAGPLAGLVIAVPALLVGLQYSAVVPASSVPQMFMAGTDPGSSVLMAFLAKLALGEAALEGQRFILHPIAFAGWLGLLVTALNLIPVGQLDGGHLVHALLGHRTARTVGIIALLALVVLGLFVWSGLLFWALVIFLIAGTEDAPPLNDVSRIGRGRMILGAAAFALLLMILLPVPHALYGSFGLYCPYA